MRGYYIDGSALSQADRLSIDQQLNKFGYIYTPVPPLDDFTFYAEDHEDVSATLSLPSGCKITRLG